MYLVGERLAQPLSLPAFRQEGSEPGPTTANGRIMTANGLQLTCDKLGAFSGRLPRQTFQ